MCPASLHALSNEKKNFPIIKEKEEEVWVAVLRNMVLRKIEKHFFERFCFFMIFRDFQKTD